MGRLRLFDLSGKTGLGPRFPDWLPPPTSCHLCGCPVILAHAGALGRSVQKWPAVYHCLGCAASVGCHQGSIHPLGTLADPATRVARRELHELLDPLWRDRQLFDRTAAYQWLAGLLGLPAGTTAHIGEMDLATCRRAAELIRPTVLVDDFG